MKGKLLLLAGLMLVCGIALQCDMPEPTRITLKTIQHSEIPSKQVLYIGAEPNCHLLDGTQADYFCSGEMTALNVFKLSLSGGDFDRACIDQLLAEREYQYVIVQLAGDAPVDQQLDAYRALADWILRTQPQATTVLHGAVGMDQLNEGIRQIAGEFRFTYADAGFCWDRENI